MALGPQVSGEVLRHLPDHETEAITQCLASLRHIQRESMDQVLADFAHRLAAGAWAHEGGADAAYAMLEQAVGNRKAQAILDRVTTRVSSGYYMLRNVAPDQIAPFLSQEHPQTIAMILSQLDPAPASGVLAQLPERLQADAAYRIATMESISPAVIEFTAQSLETSLRDVLGGNQDAGGVAVVGNILNLCSTSVVRRVFEQVEAMDPGVAAGLRSFTMDAALERVRLAVLAMKYPDDLHRVIRQVGDELQRVPVAFERMRLCVVDETEGRIMVLRAGEDSLETTPLRAGEEVWRELLEQWRGGQAWHRCLSPGEKEG